MKKFLIAAFLCCFSTQAFAVLPPLYQGKKEIETILANPKLGEYLPSGDLIQQITKTPGGYIIITNKRILPVVIRYQATTHVGPAQFTIEFKRPILHETEYTTQESGELEEPLNR